MTEIEDTENDPAAQDEPRFLLAEDLVFDRLNGSVHRQGVVRTLRPKPARLLDVLMRADRRLLSKDDLVNSVWDGLAVSDSVLTTAIKELRQTLGDSARNPIYVETLHRRGYRFLRPVRAANEAGVQAGAIPGGFPRRSGSLAAILAVAAIATTLTVAWIAWPRGAATAGPDGSVHLDVATLAPLVGAQSGSQLSEALPHAMAEQGIFASSRDDAEFIASFAPHQADDGRQIDINLTHRASGRPVLSVPIDEFAGDTIPVVSDRLALVLSHAVRCLQSLRSDASPGERTDPVLTGLVLRHCDATRLSSGAINADALTEEILSAYPDSPFAQSLHAAMMANRISVFTHGQANAETERNLEVARSLARRALDTDPDNQLALAALAFAMPASRSIAAREAALETIPDNGWIGSAAVVRRVTIYRQTGRIGEAEYLNQALVQRWPAVPGFIASLSILKDTQGDHAGARQVRETALRLFPDARMLRGLHEISEQLYGEPSPVLAGLESGRLMPPPAYRACFETFVRLRSGAPGIEDLTDCGELDVTMRARLNAVVGQFDEAMRLIRTVDPEARDIAILFYYPEFRPLWERPEMWAVAREHGLVDYWRETGRLPDLCHAGDRLATCRVLMHSVMESG